MSISTKPTSSIPVTGYDLDIVAQAFGFQSASHLQRVLDGKAPSALAEGNPKWREGVRAAASRKRARS